MAIDVVYCFHQNNECMLNRPGDRRQTACAIKAKSK
jgi:hypothetical protein